MAQEPGSPATEMITLVQSGRGVLEAAVQQFSRPLHPEDYFWLAICLAAQVMAEVQQRSSVSDRLEVLTDAIGRQGPQPNLVESLTAELAILDSLGLLWPLYRREQGEWVRDADVPLAPDFGPEAAYWLSVAHLAAALLHLTDRGAEVAEFSQVIGDLITGGYRPEYEQSIMAVLGTIRPE